MKTRKKSMGYFVSVLVMVAFALNFGGCSKDLSPISPDSENQFNETTLSSTGKITIVKVDPSKVPVQNSQITPIRLFKYTDPSQYMVEKYIEFDHDETLKLGDGTVGESKFVYKKYNLSSNMTIYFEWAANDASYSGTVDNRENPNQQLAFNDSLYLELSYEMAYLGDVDESSISLYMYDETISEWEKISGVLDYGNKRVEAYIKRFGKMGLFYIKNGQREILSKVQDVQYFARKFIEADGHGKVEVKGEGLDDSFIEIKDHDLPNDMMVTFEWAVGEQFIGLVNSVEYGTNVMLNNPVLVRVSYKNAKLIDVNEANISLYLFNEGLDDWEKISSMVDFDHNEVEAYITRFGKIALFYEEDGFLYDLVKLGENVFYTEKFIKGPKGGTLQVGSKEAGKSKIKFKKHDLPKDTKIKFEWAATQSLEGVLNDMVFGPHGTFFNSPVEVELSYKMADLTGVNETTLQIYYFNEDTGLWELIGGEIDINKKKIKVLLNHFSRYALAHSQ